MWARRTWGQTLLELLSLLGVVEGERVEVAGAPDLELGLGLATSDPGRDLLYPRLCSPKPVQPIQCGPQQPRHSG